MNTSDEEFIDDSSDESSDNSSDDEYVHPYKRQNLLLNEN